jgi:hypothetical protein
MIATPSPMLFRQNVPKILRMRISAVKERPATVRTNPRKRIIGIAVTGDDVVAWTQLLSHPAIKQRVQPETK